MTLYTKRVLEKTSEETRKEVDARAAHVFVRRTCAAARPGRLVAAQ